MHDLELWGGVECTVNRTGAGYLDQSALSGHDRRDDDLDLFAGLGLTAIRYPVLWERVSPDAAVAPDWRWSDARLARLRDLGMRPIVGLVHHGSGPRHTDLLDDGFAPGLGEHARQVAERYPWVEEWTPVNEPLTTARFAALYGHWYPHATDEGAFWRALLNQIDGTRAAMRAIRRVNPAARLIQTDDLGRTYATTRLGEQAAFNNLRRWASWDLLFGRIVPQHALWQRIARHGLGDRLRAIADDPCPPDVIGVNHYLTSDRFLDHRLQRYAVETHGGTDRLAYADTEAVRVLDPAPAGLGGAMREAWQRYRVPLAMTEIHNGCTREEQLRWAAEAWDTAVTLRGEGIDVRAVTAWSLLGSNGWNNLLTRPPTGPDAYEPGVFDVSSSTPRPTALAALWRGLPGGAPRHPVTADEGWWRRPQRLIYPPLPRPAGTRPADGDADRDGDPAPVLLICGASGMLGRAFARACALRGIRYALTGRGTLDLRDGAGIGGVLDRLRPWAVVNATGWVAVDGDEIEAAETGEAACHAVNATGAIALAAACAARGIGCLGLSSDLVFDGNLDRPYVELDTPRPLGAYGRSKAAMEAGCAALSGSLVIRTAAVFSAFDARSFAVAAADTLARGQPFAAAHDHDVSPGFAPDLVDTALDLLIDGMTGICHVPGGEGMSWAAFAVRIAHACGLDPRLVRPVAGAALGWRAPRPRAVTLASDRIALPGSLDAALARFAGDRRQRCAGARAA
ncbi:family 1 glycosylhydrolase [Sphingomonas sp. M6A6_1c]